VAGIGPSRRARLIFTLVVACLVLLEAGLTSRALRLAVSSLDLIFDNAIPSVVYLSDIEESLDGVRRELPLMSSDDASARRAAAVRALALLSTIERRAQTYEKFPAFEDEPPKQAQLNDAIEGLDEAVGAVSSQPDRPSDFAERRVLPALVGCESAVRQLIRFNAIQAGSRAKEIARAHARAELLAVLLSVSIVVVAVAGRVLFERSLARGEEDARRRMAELDAFAARVAHDLKGPLSSLLMSAGLLRKELLEDGGAGERGARSLDRVDASARRMTLLIDGLLSFARAGAVAEPGAVALVDQALENLLATFRPLADSRQVRLALEVEPGLRVAASEGVLASILQNLLRNAIDHMGETQERVVTLRASVDGRNVVFEVQDTGPGIPHDVLARLFRPFERGPTSAGGHGLGLATVKRLAEGHGGDVSVRSQVGEGSTFRVRLPRT
jgi:signal transduction histidine kinase